MSNGEEAKRMTGNTSFFALDVNPSDVHKTNQISEELAKLIGKIPGKYVEFQSFNRTGKTQKILGKSMSANAETYTAPHHPSYHAKSVFNILDPVIQTEVRIAFIKSWSTESGTVVPIYDRALSLTHFRGDAGGVIRLYAGNLKHEKIYQLLMLSPENKDNAIRRWQIENNSDAAINVPEHKFAFHLKESDEQREERMFNDQKLRTRVQNAIQETYDIGAFEVLRTVLNDAEVNTDRSFVVADMTKIQVFNALNGLVHKRSDSIDKAFGKPDVVAWRTAYKMYNDGEFTYKHNVLSYGGQTINPACAENEVMTAIYLHIKENGITASNLSKPSVGVDYSTLNSGTIFSEEEQGEKRKPGRPVRNPIT